jgi:hypothetical protein
MGVTLYVEWLLVFHTTPNVKSGDFDFREVPSIRRIAFTRATLHHFPPICPSQNLQVQSDENCLYLSVFGYQQK